MARPVGVPRWARPPLPTGRRRLEPFDVLLVALVAAFFVILSIRFLVAPLDRFDEGLTVTKAWLAASGLVPYRDFWVTYGPLDLYLGAAAFKAFGTTVLVERAAGLAVAIAYSVVAFALVRSLGLARAMRLLLAGLMLLTPLSVPALNSAVLADLVGLTALLSFHRSLRDGSRRWTVATGILAGLASDTHLEFAVAVGAGLALGYGVLAVMEHNRRPLLAYLAAAAATAVILWLPMVLLAGLQPLGFDLLVHAIRLYAPGRRIPLGQGDTSAMVLAFTGGFVLVWAWGAAHTVRSRGDSRELARVAGMLVASVLIFAWVLTRADGEHALNAWPLTAALLALLIQRRSAGSRRNLRLDAVMLVLAVVILCAAAGALALRDLARPGSPNAQLARAPIVGARAWMRADQLADLIRRIDQVVPPGHPIFVGLQRNDTVLFNDTMLYFLAARRPGTTYFEYLPGFTNAAATERAIVCQLGQSGTALAVLGPDTPGEPSNLSSKSGSTFLDGWIAAHTAARSELGPYALVNLVPGAPIACGSWPAGAPLSPGAASPGWGWP